MPLETFDLTPDPKVLIALTHTPMKPLDALCELIDNAIDSFEAARLQGNPVKSPLVAIDLPRPAELGRGEGVVRVRDNGSGLNRLTAEKALKAGFSGNNPYDNLGLFGMGFNISTGKLGRVTRFVTARLEDEDAIEVKVDLVAIHEARSFQVPVNSVPKPSGFTSGTLVEISGWWPEGNANSNFVRSLVQYGLPKVREEIGRRYGSILRARGIRITINTEPCEPFEHCIWDDSRFVVRQSGNIPAVFRFDHVVGTQKRCGACTALILPNQDSCPACGSASLRTVEERIRGWVGIQRYDSLTDYGIDLIRNGRLIRRGEKNAFFEFTDEFGATIHDYPVDQTYGRIVGEVHLNHVPVDFLKQDFQRSSPEWARAISYLRGDSSLQPKQLGADVNQSPIYKLFQGYRKVRKGGKAELYMGYWDEISGEPKRIARAVEEEMLAKFKQKLPGYYDDAKWWEQVEKADQKPLEELVECPECGAQNLQGHDSCAACGAVLSGKSCLNPDCDATIAVSATTCPQCGTAQIPEIEEPWSCAVCSERNPESEAVCTACGNPRGALHPMSRESLLARSNKSDELSIPGCSVPLADGTHSPPLDVVTYVVTGEIVPFALGSQVKPVPAFALKEPSLVEIFIDLSHPIFRAFRTRPEQMIAAEVALAIYDVNRRFSTSRYEGQHTLSNLEWQVLRTRWSATLEDSADRARSDARAFFRSLRERLPVLFPGQGRDLFEDLEDAEKRQVVDNMLARGEDIAALTNTIDNGRFLEFAGEETILKLFRHEPGAFFDGKFWTASWEGGPDLPDSAVEPLRAHARSLYLNCLEDLASFLRYGASDAIAGARARASLEFLNQKLA